MARKYSSPQIRKILDRITPLQRMEVATKMDLAARIDDLIKAKGWSKSEFAERVTKNPSEISRWLSGAHNFTIDTLCEISVAFDLEIKDLLVASNYNVITVHAEVNATSKPSPYPLAGFYEASGFAEPGIIYHKVKQTNTTSFQFC